MAKKDIDLASMRHSLSHLLAAAVVDLYPEAKPTIGPAVENGFYYDFDFGDESISRDDLPRIERRMYEILPTWKHLGRIEADTGQARQIFAHNPYKLELIDEIEAKDEDVSLYYAGPAPAAPTATDIVKTIGESGLSQPNKGEVHSIELCRGGHIDSPAKEIDAGGFKLDTVAGAYWRGDENNTMLTRIYGLAFEDEESLERYIEQREAAIERDHRKIGQELDLFTFSELVGSGLPLFTPKGTVLRRLLGSYSEQLRRERGFQPVSIPHITKTDLYKASGHWDKFGDEQFLVRSQETSDELALKPMNCPHHAQIYASQQRSYRDLPIKYLETTMVYRDEKSGELHGLSRVRSITQDDSHAFVREDQIEATILELVSAAQEMFARLDMQLKFTLSFKDDSDKWLGGQELWARAQETLEMVAKSEGLDYEAVEGEAAFYGPKMDFVAVDALGREWQLATVQLDFVQPERFSLEYIDENGEAARPVMVHAALLGSIERFLSVYIEHTAGRFPFWLAPEQVRVLSINDAVLPYIDKITSQLAETVLHKPVKFNELRYTIDKRNESLGKKIREAETAKIPVILIVGPKDEAAGEVSVRTQEGEQKLKLNELTGFLLSL